MILGQRPAPFCSYTTPELWDDPHISQQMLLNHLDTSNPLASRPSSFIDRSVDWLIKSMGLARGSSVLDLGCGPGLYANRLAKLGLEVLGIDVSRRSVAYAAQVASESKLPASYRQGSYLDCDLGFGHSAAILIYEDYCALSPTQRALLLGRVGEALEPGGKFLFDVTSPQRFSSFEAGVLREPNLMDGFWSDQPYHGTRETWTYPELGLALERYTIDTQDGSSQFWNWTHCLSPAAVTLELKAAGFVELELYGDVAGAPYCANSESYTVLAGLDAHI